MKVLLTRVTTKTNQKNQHGKQTSPGKPKTSETRNKSASVSENTKLTEAAQLVNLSESLQVGSFTEKMEKYWSDAMEDVQDRVSNQQDTETITAFTTGLVTQLFHEKARPFVERSFLYGFQEGLNQMGNQFTKLQPGDVEIAVEKHSQSYKKLTQDITSSVSACYEKDTPVAHVSHAFTANRYRIGFIAKRIAYEAYNYGVALAAERAKKTGFMLSINLIVVRHAYPLLLKSP